MLTKKDCLKKSNMKNNSTIKSFYALIPLLVILVIQYFDKENKYRFVQYIILGAMVLYLIYSLIKKSKSN